MSTPEFDLNEPLGPIPELDAATLEYFADIAFDSRLEALLENSDLTQTSFTSFTSSSYEVYPPILGYNHRDVDFDDDEPVRQGKPLTLLNTIGIFVKAGDEHRLSIEFVSDTDPSKRLKIESNTDGGFDAFEPGVLSAELTRLDLRDIAHISLLANDVDPKTLDRIAELEEPDYEYRKILNFVWDRAAQLSGIKRDVNIIEKPAAESKDDRPVTHRLVQEEYSQAEYSNPEAQINDTIDIIYEKVIRYPDLDAEEIYRLRLQYLSDGSNLIKTAQKIVRSSDSHLSSIGFFHKTVDGTVRELDASDPKTMQLFVDALEELLTAA